VSVAFGDVGTLWQNQSVLSNENCSVSDTVIRVIV